MSWYYDGASTLFFFDPPYDATIGHGIELGRKQYRMMAEQLEWGTLEVHFVD